MWDIPRSSRASSRSPGPMLSPHSRTPPITRNRTTHSPSLQHPALSSRRSNKCVSSSVKPKHKVELSTHGYSDLKLALVLLLLVREREREVARSELLCGMCMGLEGASREWAW